MNIGKIERNVPLYKYTTYRVGGIASAIVYPKMWILNEVNSLCSF